MKWFNKILGKTTALKNVQTTLLNPDTVQQPIAKREVDNPLQVAKISGSNPTQTSQGIDSDNQYYLFYGLDISPENARNISFESANMQIPGLHILSDHGDWLEAAKDDEYTVLLYFNKPIGLFEACINPDTHTGLLGMGMPQPERVWEQLGFRLYENLGEKVIYSDGEAKISVYYGGAYRINEIHYVIPEKPVNLAEESRAWRKLSFFNGGRAIIESSNFVSGKCFASEETVKNIVKFITEDYKLTLPQGFWMVEAEADAPVSGFQYCLGYDSLYDSTWDAIMQAIANEGSISLSTSAPFKLPPHDLFMQAQIGTIHIRGLLK